MIILSLLIEISIKLLQTMTQRNYPNKNVPQNIRAYNSGSHSYELLGQKPQKQKIERRSHKLSQSQTSKSYLQQKMHELISMFQEFIKSSQKMDKSQKSSNESLYMKKSFKDIGDKIQFSKRFQDLEARDKHPIIQIPEQESNKLSQKCLQKWITNLCKTVFSIGFNYFTHQKMTFEQLKVFCSESFFINITRLAQRFSIQQEEMDIINKHLKYKLIPYLELKYPLTQCKGSSKNLQKEVQQMNHKDFLENDYLYLFGIMFKYRDEGNYNDYIMQTLNKIIQSIDQQSSLSDDVAKVHEMEQEEITNFKDFQLYMTDIFEKCYDWEWMNKKVSQSLLKKKYSLGTKQNQLNSELLKKKEQYKQQVKQYTNFSIKKKFTSSTVPYTSLQIRSKHLTIQNSTILRTLTKWCEQLQKKFVNPNYFMEKTQSIQSQNPQYINPFYKFMKIQADKLMAQQKKEIEIYKNQIEKHCYKYEASLLYKCITQEDDLTYINQFQKVYGKFSSQMAKNINSYTILYLNRLIHGLLKVSKDLYERTLAHLHKFNWDEPPNLITFSVGDCMRCKFVSKERQIIKIYCQIKSLSNRHPQKFKIIRVKNRLNCGTHDILINIKFNNHYICEIQLAVESSAVSQFLKKSNQFCHFLYELQRSLFGPVSQLSNIWNYVSKKSPEFDKIRLNLQKKRRKCNVIKKIAKHKNHQFTNYDLPFECSYCNTYYYHNYHIISNKKCTQCDLFKCVKCNIEQMSEEQLKNMFFRTRKLKQISNKIKMINRFGQEKIPEYGACAHIETLQIQVQFFRYDQKAGRIWFLDDSMKKIGKTIKLGRNQRSSSQQTYNYLTFELRQEDIMMNFLDKKNIIRFQFEQYLSKTFKQEKQILILTEVQLTENQIEQSIKKIAPKFDNGKNKIRKIECGKKNYQNIDFLNIFHNVTTLILTQNSALKNTDQISNFEKLEKLQIRYSYSLEELNQKFCQLKRLQQMEFFSCGLIQLPKRIDRLTFLQQINVNQNQIKTLPSEIVKLQNLQNLFVSENKLEQLPDNFGNLKKLRKLNLSKNKFETYPPSLKNLENLENLNISFNPIGYIQNLNTFKKLKIINLKKIQLTEFPLEITELQKLQQLNLSNNKIYEIPPSIKYLKHLKKLKMNKNKIQLLPKQIGQCKNLGQLFVGNNLLYNLPDEIAYLWNNNFCIDISGNKFEKMPQCLLQLDHLIFLNISDNPIQGFPQEIREIQALQKLNVSNLKIQEIPTFLQELPQLKSVNFNNNLIEDVPPWFNKLFLNKKKKLKQAKIQLNNNRIKKLDLALISYNGYIDLKDNLLRQIPQQLTFFKTQITKINLKNNEITFIPREIKLFQNLTFLDLSHNSIKILPFELSYLIKLKQKKGSKDDHDQYGMRIQNNPIEKIQCEEFVADVIGHAIELIINQARHKKFDNIQRYEYSNFLDYKK